MRKLLLINPNTTVAMTERMAAAAARSLPDWVAIEALTATAGFPVIASPEAYEAAAVGMVALYERAGSAHDAVIIGCFGDPGLEALRAAARAPVFGLAESSIREADRLGEPFAILTMGGAWIDILNERVALAAPRTPFVGVFAAEGTGLDVGRQDRDVAGELERVASVAVAAGARTLILGGAAFAGTASRIAGAVRQVDCVKATLRHALTQIGG